MERETASSVNQWTELFIDELDAMKRRVDGKRQAGFC